MPIAVSAKSMNSLFWRYFSYPFPKAEGFSAYRMPGLLVHVPVILIFASLGVWLCGQSEWLYLLLAVYVIVGLYIGRDVAILAHYNPLITIAVLAAAFFLVGGHEDWPQPGPVAAIVVTLALAALFVWYANWRLALESEGEPQLHSIVQSKNLKAIERALDAGADPNEKDTLLGWGYAPLHVAVAMAGSTDAPRIQAIIELLAKRGADLNAVCDNHGTPLQLAADGFVVDCLIGLGADPNRPDRNGMTPLHAAVGRGDREIAEKLLAAGANINPAGANRSVLGQAAWAGRFELVPWLIEKGARLYQDDMALGWVATSDDPQALETAQRLIDSGARVTDELLCWAATPEMIGLLARHGASIDALLREGRNPVLTRGMAEARAARLRALRDLGCDLCAADKHGATVLHDVASYFEGALTLPQILPVLKESGVDVNATNGDGATALHLLVETLLPYVTDRVIGMDRKYPVEEAVRLVQLLLDAGADPRLTNKTGEDVVAIAKRLDAPRAFLKFLREACATAPC